MKTDARHTVSKFIKSLPSHHFKLMCKYWSDEDAEEIKKAISAGLAYDLKDGNYLVAYSRDEDGSVVIHEASKTEEKGSELSPAIHARTDINPRGSWPFPVQRPLTR